MCVCFFFFFFFFFGGGGGVFHMCVCGGDIQISTLNKLYQKVRVIQHSERETGY